MTEQEQDKVFTPLEADDSPFLTGIEDRLIPYGEFFAQFVHLIEAGCLQKANGLRTIEFTPDAVEKFAELYLSDPDPQRCSVLGCKKATCGKCTRCDKSLCSEHGARDPLRGVNYFSCLTRQACDGLFPPEEPAVPEPSENSVPVGSGNTALALERCSAGNCTNAASEKCDVCKKMLCPSHAAVPCQLNSTHEEKPPELPVPNTTTQKCGEEGCDITAQGFCGWCGKTLCKEHTMHTFATMPLCGKCSDNQSAAAKTP